MDNNTSFEEILRTQGKLVYTNTGNSMMPLLRQHRDLLIIAPASKGRLKMWDVPLYKRDNGQYILHRVLWVRKDDYVLCGDNQWFVEVGISDRHVIGVLEAVNRDGKIIPLRKGSEYGSVPLWYHIYVFLWCVLFPLRALILSVRAKYLSPLRHKIMKLLQK